LSRKKYPELWKEAEQSARNEEGAPRSVAGGEALKKSMIAILAGVLLLSAAMPAFAKKHHKHHKHHHHNHHVAQQAR